MRSIFTLVWKLLLVCLVAGLVLGLVNEITKQPILEQQRIAQDEARMAAFPGAAKFEPIRLDTEKVHGFYKAFDENGKCIGYVASSREYGYGGDIEVVVGMAMDGRIVGTVIGGNTDFSETAGLGAKVKDEAFAAQFIGREYGGEPLAYSSGGGGYIIPAGTLRVQRIESEGSEPDAVSGATYSSRAVLAAFNSTVSELYKLIKEG